MVRCAITSAMAILQTHPQFFEQPSPRSCTTVSLEHLRRHRPPKHEASKLHPRAILLLRWSLRRHVCLRLRTSGRRPKPLWCRRHRHRRVCRRHEYHPRQWAPGRCCRRSHLMGQWPRARWRRQAAQHGQDHVPRGHPRSCKTGTRARTLDRGPFQPFQIRNPES